MSVTLHSVNAIYFDGHGHPQMTLVPIQKITIGPAIELPLTFSLFATPASTRVLAITFLRARKTFTVTFPDMPRYTGRGPGSRVLRNLLPRRAKVLVCRTEGVVSGYTNCDVGDTALAIRAADFAIAYCKGNYSQDLDDLHVRVCEYIRKRKN